MTAQRYPFAPLAAAMGCSEHAACLRLNLSGSTMQEYRRNGMSEKVADRMAVKAGLHPFEVWPEMAEHSLTAASIPCPECHTLFVPLRRSHVFCEKRCYQRRYKREKARKLYAEDPAFRQRQIAKAKAYRDENARAVKIKKRAYYLANRVEHLAKKKARYQARRSEAA